MKVIDCLKKLHKRHILLTGTPIMRHNFYGPISKEIHTRIGQDLGPLDLLLQGIISM